MDDTQFRTTIESIVSSIEKTGLVHMHSCMAI